MTEKAAHHSGLPHFSFHFPKVRVHVKRSHKYVFNGRGSYLYALRKYGFQPPPLANVFVNEAKNLMVKTGSKNQQPGELSTEDIQNDSMYLCPVTIGEGPRAVTVNLDFDTGSSDLWVFSSELPQELQKGHTIYHAAASPTAKLTPEASWIISYGDGSNASGNVYTDTVTLGGLAIKNQHVQCAQQISTAFSSGTADGLLGLAFKMGNRVTPGPVPTPVDNLNTQGVTPKGSELFTCMLTRHTEEPGFYTFGYIDQSLLGPGKQLYYFPIVDDSGFWKVDSPVLTVNGKTIPRPGNTAVCDTGTTLILVDSSTCAAIYEQVPGSRFDQDANGYVFPESTPVSNLPTISICLGSGDEQHARFFEIYPGDLNFSPAEPGWIFGGIQDRGSQPFDILGDVFLKNLYCIWDAGSKRFGAVQRVYHG